MGINKNIYITILFIGLIIAISIHKASLNRLRLYNKFTPFLILVLVFLMGTVPIIFDGGDRNLYSDYFEDISKFGLQGQIQDKLFGVYLAISTLFLDVELWFILTAFIYVFNAYYFSKKSTINYFVLFLALITNFTFFAYGTNTIRAGFAASFLLLALANRNKTLFFYLLLISSISLHGSMILPALAIIIAKKFNWTKYYLIFWALCIPASLLIGGLVQSYIGVLFEDERLTQYLTTQETQYKVGFRIDFIIYSMLPVIFGYYYIYKKKYKNELYLILYNSYLICNAFWILVISANFSDRFAYLSWYIYMPVMIFPLLNTRLLERQSIVLSIILVGNILFTLYMFN